MINFVIVCFQNKINLWDKKNSCIWFMIKLNFIITFKDFCFHNFYPLENSHNNLVNYMTINISFIWLAKSMRFVIELYKYCQPSISAKHNLDLQTIK